MKNQTILTFVALAFILSGVCGLIYEVVWAKYLALFIGNTTYAHTVVLATFMGGLAAGAYVWGRRSDGTLSRLRLYSLLEILIGVYCFFYPTMLHLLENAYIGIVSGVEAPSDGLLVLSLKLGVSIASLFFPTFLMGGTLPVLARFVTKNIDETGKEVGILYFLNSFGAVIGTFFAGFILVEAFGLRQTIYMAATINLIIGTAVFFLSYVWKDELGAAEPAVTRPDLPGTQAAIQIFSQREITIALGTAFLSGFAAMVYELTWIRMLTLIIGSSVYSFSLMLMAFISGITIGSYIVAKIVERVKNLYRFLGFCELAVGVSMLLVLPIYQRLPYYFWVLGSIVSKSLQGYYVFIFLEFLFCFLLMLLPTIFLGMALPVISRIAATDIKRIGRSIGNVFSINTVGTVFGSLLTGLLFIPWIGVHHSIEIGICLSLLLATVIILTGRGSIVKSTILAFAGWIFMAAYVVFMPEWSTQSSAVGVFRSRLNIAIPASYGEYEARLQKINVKFFKEGVHATVLVTGKEPNLTLVVNGKADASSWGDLGTQLLAAHLPGILSKKFDSVLVIGLGSGITVGAATRYPLKHLDVIEISPEVREAETMFREHNHHALADPRVKLTVEDAITYLKTTKKRYDVIINEPSNPWIAGIGNLFTTEFFELSKRKLTPDGMMVQWIHLYESNDEVLGLILRTFSRVFPYVSIWMTQRHDIVLIGSASPQEKDFAEMERAISQPPVKADLERIKLRNLASLLSTEMISPTLSKTLLPFGASNTEENPYLEYMAPRFFFMNNLSTFCYDHDMRNDLADTTLLIHKYFAYHTMQADEYRNIGIFFQDFRQKEHRLASLAYRKYLTMVPGDITVLTMYANALYQDKNGAEADKVVERLAGMGSPSVEVLEQYAQSLYLKYRQESSFLSYPDVEKLEQLIKKGKALAGDSAQAFVVLEALLDYRSGRNAEALRGFKEVMNIRDKTDKENPLLNDEQLLACAADAAVKIGDIFTAITFADQALGINPGNTMAMSVFYRAKQLSVKPVAK